MQTLLHNLRRQHSKGFTLLELLVVAVLVAVLFGLLIRWIFSLIGVASAGSSVTTLQSDTSYAAGVFASDIQMAVPCDSYGLGSPFQSVSSTSISFYVPDSMGGVDLVLWRVETENGLLQLQRALVSGDGMGNCSNIDTSSPSWTTILSQINPALYTQQDPTVYPFTPWEAGSPGTVPDTCSSAAACDFQAVELNVQAVSPGPGQPVDTIDPVDPVTYYASNGN